ncbi:MAG: phosphoribosylformylglycinamidine synthase subunit PurL [Candidatus Methanosuratus sp.]|nr:phosphoribosylformylglycinamidine synthase subunit PurL [Candidatus Methanosuratincola sp.]
MREGLIRRVSEDPPIVAVDLREAEDADLLEISRGMGLALSLPEMKAIKEKFGRPLTDVELQTFGQTWSEHCIHKTFRGVVETESGAVEGLLKTYIARATRELDRPWCFSVFEDNAGLVDFDNGHVIAAKVETHNHPSAIEPFGGAATGVGGVIRDILGVWGEPIAVSDVLCFGPLDIGYSELVPGIKHPRYIYKGVVAGVGSYGNNMGIPNVSGAIIFDRNYTGNVVVYCGCFGILPKRSYIRQTMEGDLAVLVGGRTGRDGIHGVTFASTDLPEESEGLRSAVQIPNPLVEERLRRAVIRVRDGRLASGITDLGGGGISCATGEMASRSGLGLIVNLDNVKLKEGGVAPWEIWVSESQERMLFSVPSRNLENTSRIFEDEELEWCVLGSFNSTKRLKATYRGATVCDLGLDFLYSPPRIKRRAVRVETAPRPLMLEEPEDLASEILSLLSDPNVGSREGVVRTYDHEVRGATVVKPVQGESGSHNDAGVIKPLKDSWVGVVISCGINPFYPDPYWMAACSLEEALRNNVAVGGRRIAILDNFVWGNPEREDRIGSLLRACEACYDFAKAFGTPFISGKDSLYNESPMGPVRPTLLITGVGIIPDVRKAVTSNLKAAGDPIYLLGTTKEEVCGSAYLRSKGVEGGDWPRVDPSVSKRVMNALTKAIDLGIVAACHDLSDGGLGAAASEMVIGSEEGIFLDLGRGLMSTSRNDFAVFSESAGRFLVEVRSGSEETFEATFEGLPVRHVGEVLREGALRIQDLKGREHVLEKADLLRSWRGD